MKNIILYLILFVLIPYAMAASAKDECYNCHFSNLEDKPGKMYSGDIHFVKGITCSGCHGGNSSSDDQDIAMSKNEGFTGVPNKKNIVDLCLNCHLNENTMKKFGSIKSVSHLKHFKQSAHSKNDIATCITCHGVHNIKKVSDPSSPVYALNEVKLCSKCHSDANYMKTFNPGMATDQFDKYKTSIHGIKNLKGDPKTATCSDCHSAHNIFNAKDPRASTYAFNVPSTCGKCHSDKDYMKSYNIPVDQLENYTKSVHGKALLKKHDAAAPACNDCHGNHGAIPVGVESISHVCGTCHALNAEMFNESPHANAFKQRNIPQCEVCHSNHLIESPTDALISRSNQSKCISCHRENNDKGFLALIAIEDGLDSLLKKQKYASKLLEKAENLGMDISDYRYELNELKKVLIEARTITHKASLPEFMTVMKSGFAIVNQAINDGNNALDDYYMRRWGLGWATLIITLLAVALYLKIKKIEKKQKS